MFFFRNKSIQLYQLSLSLHSLMHAISHCLKIDWPHLLGLPQTNPRILPSLLEARLSKNTFERDFLRQEFMSPSFRFESMMEWIFDQIEKKNDEETQGGTAAGLSHLTKEDWLCIDCVQKILKQWLWRWSLESKRSGQPHFLPFLRMIY